MSVDIEQARHLRDRITGSFEVDHRAITNTEMDTLRHLRLHELEEKRERDGCCSEDGPRDDGRCRHGRGKCRLVERAETILWKADTDGKE